MTLEKLDKLRIEVNFFNLIMSIYKTTTGNIILNSKRLNAFLLILRTGMDVYFYFSYSIV